MRSLVVVHDRRPARDFCPVAVPDLARSYKSQYLQAFSDVNRRFPKPQVAGSIPAEGARVNVLESLPIRICKDTQCELLEFRTDF